MVAFTLLILLRIIPLTCHTLLLVTNIWLHEDGAIFILLHASGFDQSIAKGGCLHEGSYPVEGVPKSCNTMEGLQKEHCHQEFSNASSQHVRSAAVDDLEATVSQSITSPVSVGNGINNEVFAPSEPMKEEASNVNPVAEDSEMEYDDLYLSDCRISLVGFEEKEQSRLVYMIRKGGGTRHMLPSEKLTHIILGVPSEIEKREIRRLASFGVINVVRATWLEECDQAKRELPVLPRHIVSELLSKDLTSPCIGLSADANGIKRAKSFPSVPRVGTRQVSEDKSSPADFVLQKRRMMGNSGIGVSSDEVASRSAHPTELRPAIDENKDCHKLEYSSGPMSVHPSKSSNTFKDKIFYFSSLFPLDQRPEVIDWIKQGGGLLVDDERKMDADFVVERHGLLQSPDALYKCTAVSTHWIRSSLEEGSMEDVADHILYSPLRCHIPVTWV
ncbi:putative DNA topoisomerase 2-binding protein 1-A isoform X1 [Iris pallida]|uniref:DNA topoisomerase 2-binding protein 1-A isoform X1 n=1 Tax=Iris pallida TaxID=29817 RepID=A0AAX6HD34_IRIPA|nr:putative DNA topoisomerase 2-binding protein 1-A isoform X1 [Iris pallida]